MLPLSEVAVSRGVERYPRNERGGGTQTMAIEYSGERMHEGRKENMKKQLFYSLDPKERFYADDISIM